MDEGINFLHGFQASAERLLDAFFHGSDAMDVSAVGLVCAVISFILMVFAFRRPRDNARAGGLRILFRLVMLLLFVASIALVLLTIVVAGAFEECQATRGTVTYQFSAVDETPKVGKITLKRCRSRPIGIPDYGPWAVPYVERDYLK